MANRKTEQRKNGKMRAVPRTEPATAAPGVQQPIEYCEGCRKPVRKAILQGDEINTTEIYVDHMPNEQIMPDGSVLLLFTPHNRNCKAPKRGLIMPDGRLKVF